MNSTSGLLTKLNNCVTYFPLSEGMSTFSSPMMSEGMHNTEHTFKLSIFLCHQSIGGGESLDTPRVLPPPADSDETISSTSRDDICGTTSTSTITSTLTTSSHAYVPPQTATTTCPASLTSAR